MSIVHFLRVASRMWAPSSNERRYRAALAILLSPHGLLRLDGPSRARVDAEVIEIYKPLGFYPWWRLRPGSSVRRAAEEAIAMYRLELPTGVPSLKWGEVLHPWHRDSPIQLEQDFSASHPATHAATQYLQSNGIPS